MLAILRDQRREQQKQIKLDAATKYLQVPEWNKPSVDTEDCDGTIGRAVVFQKSHYMHNKLFKRKKLDINFKPPAPLEKLLEESRREYFLKKNE